MTLVHLDGVSDYVEGWVYCTSNFSTVSGGDTNIVQRFVDAEEVANGQSVRA